jgi:hypothetical protein
MYQIDKVVERFNAWFQMLGFYSKWGRSRIVIGDAGCSPDYV